MLLKPRALKLTINEKNRSGSLITPIFLSIISLWVIIGLLKTIKKDNYKADIAKQEVS